MTARLTVVAATATLLTSVTLYPLQSSGAWFWDALGVVIVAAAVGALTRLRPLAPPACLAAGLAGVLVYLNTRFAGQWSWERAVPTPASLHHVWWLATRGMAETAQYAPPVPGRHGVLVLTAAGVGVIAVSVDLLAVRLRRPVLAGVPLLVLFCVPLTTAAPTNGLAASAVFCLAMLGYLALLAADGRERLRLWGRLVGVWHAGATGRWHDSETPDTSELSAAGRRIGLAALVLALCVPLVVPGLPRRRLSFVQGAGVGPGPGQAVVTLPDPVAQMNKELREPQPEPVLTYQTGNPDPPYLQVYVLTKLTDSAWVLATPKTSRRAGAGPLPGPPGLSAHTTAATVRESVALSPGLTSKIGTARYLPVPYPATALHVTGNWHVNPGSLTVFSYDTPLSGLRYTVRAKELDPSPRQLATASTPPASVAKADLTVPASFQGLRSLAQKVAAGHATTLGKAIALQRWFADSGRFAYSLNAKEPKSSHALIQFLTVTKRGYCQQFAFAMAVLARLLGIPSRVAVGYTQGAYVAGSTWQITTADAHAWPELYFQGAGWLRFEPTPAGSGPGQAGASEPSYSLSAASGTTGGTSPSAGAGAPGLGAGLSAGGGSSAGHAKHPQASAGRRQRTQAGGPPVGVIVLAVLCLLAIAPRSARSLVRRRRWLTAAGDARRAHAAWREIRDDLTDHKIACPASESPRALAARITRLLGLAAADREALWRVAMAEERASYAAAPAPSADLRGDVAAVRRAVSRSSTPATRWSARIVPGSAVALARAGAQQVMDVFGWMDVLTPRTAGRLIPGPLRRRGARTGDERAADAFAH